MEQIAIFCDVDDFCRDYEEYCKHSLLMDKNEVVPKTKMALSMHLFPYYYTPSRGVLASVPAYLL